MHVQQDEVFLRCQAARTRARIRGPVAQVEWQQCILSRQPLCLCRFPCGLEMREVMHLELETSWRLADLEDLTIHFHEVGTQAFMPMDDGP